jgi:2-dehydro-3-deoxyphosphogluconate aldolase/(4S)-4-hydroxy-2-oxoglutarate aldolase
VSEDPLAPLRRAGILPIARGVPAADLEAAAGILLEVGIGVVEVTMNSTDAAGTIRRLAGMFAGRLVVGAGTVLDADQAAAAVDAGAEFLVTPHVDDAVAAAAHRLKVPLIPGALTPTEILRAWRAGAAIVKLFPAVTVGPPYLRQLRGPLPDIPLLPTGGVSVENTAEFIAAGAVAVGVGGALLGRRAGDRAWLRTEVMKFVAAVQRGRQQHA